jgi:hypothetical protein
MCELYSPTGIVRRQLVSRHNVMIKPRLNILAAGHPKRTIECLSGQILKKLNNFMRCFTYIVNIFSYFFIIGVGLKSQEQKDQHEDGLFNRFLIAVAYKHRPNRETFEADNKVPKIAHLFYLTKKLHRNNEQYIYNDEGNFSIILKIKLLFYCV